MGYIDIIMVTLLIIVISVVIGLNIVSVVDKKLSDVQINIPPFPKPNVIVNINKKDVDNFDVSVSQNTNPKIETKINNQLDNNTAKEQFNSDTTNQVTNNTTKEHFNSDIGYQPANFNKVIITNVKKNNKLENPDEDDVVNYENYVCYKKNNQINEPNQIPASINESFRSNKYKNQSLNGLDETKKKNLRSSDTYNQLNWDEIDPAEYYRRFRTHQLNLDDPKLKGYNIGNFSSSAGINQIGKIELDTKFRYPKPNNYSFNQ